MRAPAENPRFFTYLADARARQGVTIRTTAIDGRLGLRAMPAASYDLIVIDAFSSDTIPTHLITREAVALYESRLKARGMVAFHVSSRFFDLPPVVARIAADRHLVTRLIDPAGAYRDHRIGRALRRLCMTHRDADAREQLVHAERLRQVVVGAGVERFHLVLLATTRREHDDRHA